MPKHMNRRISLIESVDAPGAGTPPEGNAPTDPRHPNFKDTTFTQEQVTAFMTREKDQGKRAGAREYADKLSTSFKDAGFAEDTPLAEILALAVAKRDADEALKTEAQKTADAAAKTQADANLLLAEAKQDRFTAKVERALASASNVAVATASLTAYGVSVDSTDDELTAAVEKLKSDAPGLFTTVQQHNTDPGSTRQPRTPVSSPKDAAKKFAESRGWRQAS